MLVTTLHRLSRDLVVLTTPNIYNTLIHIKKRMVCSEQDQRTIHSNSESITAEGTYGEA